MPVQYDLKKTPSISFPFEEKYTKDCPGNLQYHYYTTNCGGTCRSQSEPDKSCKVRFTPLDGCSCAEGTFLNDQNKCVPVEKCPCYLRNQVIKPKKRTHVNGKAW